MNEIPPPNNVKGLESLRGVIECSSSIGLDYARFTIERLEKAGSGFPIDLLPIKKRVNGPLLGAYPSHKRNLEYDLEKSLREVIEMKINGISGEKGILAINAPRSYTVFECKEFSYDILDDLRKSTYAIDFVVASIDADALFVFHEDSPACFLSFGSAVDFERGFMPLARAVSIFSTHMDEWSITSLEKERIWLDRVERYFGMPHPT